MGDPALTTRRGHARRRRRARSDDAAKQLVHLDGSVFGGRPILLLSNASALSWIPDRSPPRVLFSQVDTGAHMSIVTAARNRSEARTVHSPADSRAMAHRSFLSPDRKNVLVAEMAGGWRPCRQAPFGGVQSSPAIGKLIGPSPGQCPSQRRKRLSHLASAFPRRCAPTSHIRRNRITQRRLRSRRRVILHCGSYPTEHIVDA